MSSSAQITTALPAGTVSSSAQVTVLIPAGTVSASSQVSYTGLSSIPSGIVSSSAQVQLNNISGSTFATNDFIFPQKLTVTDAVTAGKFVPTANTVTGNGMYLAAANTLAFSTNGVEGMRLDSGGNLGVGVSSLPANVKATIAGANVVLSSRGNLYVHTTDTATADFGAQLSLGGSFNGTSEAPFATIGGKWGGGTTGYMQFGTLTTGTVTEKMRLDASGNLGIGVTPTTALHVKRTSGASIVKTNSTDTAQYASLDAEGNNGSGTLYRFGSTYSTSAQYIASSTLLESSTGPLVLSAAAAETVRIYTNGSERMRITSAGNVGIGTTSPTLQLHLTGFARVLGVTVNETGGTIAAFIGYEKTWIGSGASNSLAIAAETGNNIIFYTNGSATPRMTLNTTGNLGVGVTPSARLHIGGGTDTALRVDTTASGHLTVGQFANGAFIGTSSSDATFGFLRLGTGGAEKARITAGGYTKHSNNGTYLVSAGSFHEFYQSNIEIALALYAANGLYTSSLLYGQVNSQGTQFKFISWLDDTGEKFFVRGDGNVYNTNTVYGGISDAKLKQDITDAGSQWDDLKAVRFRKYRFISDVKAKGEDAPYLLGVVAQELQATSPGLVDSHPDTEQVEVEVEVEKSRPVMREVEEVVTDAEGVESVVLKSVPMLDEDGAPVTETYTETETHTETRKTGTETLSVKSSILLMKAAVALQEAMARIETLEAEVVELKKYWSNLINT